MRRLGIAAVVLLLGSVALADSVVLKNGARYDGAILEEDEASITVQSDGTSWVFARSNVAEVVREDAGRDREFANQAAFRAELERRRKSDAEQAARKAAREAEHAAAKRRARAAREEDSAAEQARIRSRLPVLVYGTAWCPACRKAVAFLRRRGIPFRFLDVEANPAARREKHRKAVAAGKNPGAVPLVDVGGKVMVGFSGEWIENALRR